MKHQAAIFIHKEDRQLGPFTEPEVRRHWANGIVDAGDLAWHPDLDHWIYVRDLFSPPKIMAPPQSQFNEGKEMASPPPQTEYSLR